MEIGKKRILIFLIGLFILSNSNSLQIFKCLSEKIKIQCLTFPAEENEDSFKWSDKKEHYNTSNYEGHYGSLSFLIFNFIVKEFTPHYLDIISPPPQF